ncbi:MAG: TonB-dependent receptor [Bacteroidia bacterium]|nr:TonB-dependent receptor [Bacteroidia bacterium]
MLKNIYLLKIFLFCLIQASLAQEEKTDEVKLSYKLDEVVVTATKTPRMLAKVPVQTVLITKQEIKETNAKNISDLLSSVPGIYIRDENIPGSSSYQSSLAGLGFDKGYSLVLINGERVLGGGMGEYGISVNQLPVEMIERIEIVKGPASALYGSDAMGGIVNIITKSIPEKPLFTSSIGAGSYDTYFGGIGYGQQIGKLGFYANFNREDAKRGRYSASEDDFTGHYALTKLQYKIFPNGTLNLGLNYDDMKWEYATEKKYRISPSLEINLPEKSSFKLKSYYYNLDFDLFSPGYTRRFGTLGLMQAETQYTKSFGKGNVAITGIEYIGTDINMDVGIDTCYINQNTDLLSLYLQDEITLHPFNFVLGGRIDHHSVYGTECNPKISGMWNIGDNTRLRLSGGRAFKSPTIRQLYVFFKHGNWWNKPNENLEPEKSWGYSAGFEQTLNFLHGNISVFRNDINDIIVQNETDEKIDGVPVRIWENCQKAYIQGIEFNINAFVFKNVNVNLAYTYLDTKNFETGKRLPFNPEHSGNAGISYKIPKWKLSFHWSTKYFTPCFSDEANTKKVVDYSVSDFKLIKGITKGLEFSFEIDNIFNSNYGEPDKDWLGRTITGKLSFLLSNHE